MCKIVIIDTGIDINNKYIKFKKIDGVLIKKSTNDNEDYTIIHYYDNPSCIQDTIGHGTAVGGIISQHNSDSELFVIKLFDWDSIQVDEDLLCYALEYVLHNIDCSLINLSLGICVISNDRLCRICNELNRRKKYIISAFDNNGAISYPAAFDSVIGVTSGHLCYNKNDYYITDSNVVNVCAAGRAQRLIWLDGKVLVGSGNSYACAHITGILSNYINSHQPSEALNQCCKGKILIDKTNNVSLGNPTQEYKKAVLFPFNKEMHSIIRFQELLSFEVVGVYDVKQTAHIGATTNDLLRIKGTKNLIINSIKEIDWDSFDTFILGHTDELIRILNTPSFIQELIDEILSHRKHLYAFDDLSSYKIPKKLKKLVYFPKITIDDVPVSPFGKLYRQSKPILGIFGTSSRQGKYTLQLKIRSELIKRGYKISQVGTEPSSLLFGMDIIFPIGYNSSVYIDRKDTVSYLNAAINNCSKNSEIIIVGGQSGTVIRDEGNLDNYNFTQLDFLYATQPDAVILCININDDFDIILRTKNFIESSVGCKVIAFVVFPLHYKRTDSSYQQLVPLTLQEFENYKIKFSNIFNEPIFLLNDDISNLIEHTINYFSD